MPSLARDLAIYFVTMIAFMSILSLPLEPPTLLAIKVAEPYMVALVASASAAVAAVFDWHFVRRVFRMGALDRLRKRKLVQRAERMAKVAPFATVAIFAALPLPFTIVRILVPVSGYPLGRYVAAVALGRLPRILALGYIGAAFEIPTDVIVGVLIATVLIAAAVFAARRLGWLPKGPMDEPEPPAPSV